MTEPPLPPPCQTPARPDPTLHPYSTDVSSVTQMDYMFSGATSFNQKLRGWFMISTASKDHMFDGCPGSILSAVSTHELAIEAARGGCGRGVRSPSRQRRVLARDRSAPSRSRQTAVSLLPPPAPLTLSPPRHAHPPAAITPLNQYKMKDGTGPDGIRTAGELGGCSRSGTDLMRRHRPLTDTPASSNLSEPVPRGPVRRHRGIRLHENLGRVRGATLFNIRVVHRRRSHITRVHSIRSTSRSTPIPPPHSHTHTQVTDFSCLFQRWADFNEDISPWGE